MGRNKFSQKEIEKIGKLLKLKNAGTRYQQKMIRHTLRVDYEFNISDFNVQGKAFGYDELQECIRRQRILILDDATIEAMKAKRARDKARDEAARQAEAIASGEAVDWQEVQKEWEAYYGNEEWRVKNEEFATAVRVKNAPQVKSEESLSSLEFRVVL